MLSGLERKRIRELGRQGLSHRQILAVVGGSLGSIGRIIRKEPVGMGIPLEEWKPGGRRLSLGEREDIATGCAQGRSFAVIARSLGRATSTVSREVGANGGAPYATENQR